MKTVILCGGLGTRLREFTEVQPKPMVEIGGRPILWYIMKAYATHGMKDFVLCLGYKGHQIKQYFLNYRALNSDVTVRLGDLGNPQIHGCHDGEDDWTVTLADTGELTMTGSRLKRVTSYLGDSTIALTYGDGLSNVDLTAALEFHRSHGHLATLTGVHPSSRYGELVREGHKIVKFAEKPQSGNALINGGFFFFEPEFLRYIEGDDDCVLEREPLQRCAADGELCVYEHLGFWQCMDTLRDWQVLQRLWESGSAPWMIW
jgi:glucose-1-phosphate cytidylyltransferase